MSDRFAQCPQCGYPLSVSVERTRKTGEIIIRMFCEGDGDDVFEFQILTGYTNDTLGELNKVHEKIEGKARIELLRRKSDPYYSEDSNK